jgi:hypothetical protein
LPLPHVRPKAKAPQPQPAPRKITVIYDRSASGQTIYAYVGGNPVSYTDPEGKQVFRVILKAAPFVLLAPTVFNILEQYFFNRTPPATPPTEPPEPPPNSCTPSNPWGHSSQPQFYLQSPVPQHYEMPEVPELDMPPEQFGE